MRTFVIGDIHGWLKPLHTLLQELRRTAADGDTLVFVGDYVDRGPDSRQVVDLVLAQDTEWQGPVVCLKGNHEAMMLGALESGDERRFRDWLTAADGTSTVASYTPEIRLQAFIDAMPGNHRDFFNSLRLFYQDSNGIYVHAGLRPGTSPEANGEDDLLWIREPFLRSKHRWGKPVVFGHTPQFEPPASIAMNTADLKWRPLNEANKIGIDTGIAYGGPLTAVIMPDRRFVQARR